MKYETVQTLKDEEFKRSTGISRVMFEKMLSTIRQGWRNFGRKPKLSRADQLLMALMYWREYRTEFHIGLAYGASESTVCRTIQKAENVLMKSGEFRLPGKKALQPSDTVIEVVLIDATEPPIEQPQKNNSTTTVEKETPHAKSSVDRQPKTQEIIAIAFSHGRQHDFQLFKESQTDLSAHIVVITDSGYQGLGRVHEDGQTPAEKSKRHPLTQEQKSKNRQIP